MCHAGISSFFFVQTGVIVNKVCHTYLIVVFYFSSESDQSEFEKYTLEKKTVFPGLLVEQS